MWLYKIKFDYEQNVKVSVNICKHKIFETVNYLYKRLFFLSFQKYSSTIRLNVTTWLYQKKSE